MQSLLSDSVTTFLPQIYTFLVIFYRLKFLLTIFLSKNSDALNVFQMARVRVGKTIVGTYCMGSERGGKTKDALHRCLIKRQDALHGFPTWSTVVAFLNRINNTLANTKSKILPNKFFNEFIWIFKHSFCFLTWTNPRN